MKTKLRVVATQQMETPSWIDEYAVSRITGIPVQSLRNWRFLRKGFPYFKIGKSVRYRLDEVIRFMEERKVDIEN